jgi:GT2 family glycosyltransferase
MIDLSVITVTHHSEDCILDQMHSVRLGALKSSYEQIIVDNASRDETVGLIQKSEMPGVSLILNGKNEGFARANHRAVVLAQGRYFLFLNPDMRLEMGSLDQVVVWMDAHPDVGIAGCKLLDREGCCNQLLEPRRFPPFLFNLTFFLGIQKYFPQLIRQFYYEGFDSRVEQEVDSVRGAFMCVRREVIERLGRAFDPRYFLLFEDLDFCREVKGIGYRVMYLPHIACTDFFHRSFLHHSRLWKYVQMSRGLLVYARKWYRPHERWLLAVAAALGFILRVLYRARR